MTRCRRDHRSATSCAGSRVSNRRFRAATRMSAGLFAAVVALTACSPRAADADPAVRFWSFTGIDQAAQVDAFLGDNPDVEIELSEVGTSIETADALTAALSAGSPPDLVLIQADQMPRFVAAADHFLDLRELGADPAGSDYLDWAFMGAVGPDGEVIGIPTDVGGMSLAYRADLFESAGLPTDPDDVAALWPTWEAFIEVGEQFTHATGAPFVDNVSTTLFTNAANQLETMYYSIDGDLVYAANADLREVFDLSIRAHEAGISAGMRAFSPGWSAGISRGAFAVMPAPSWMLRVIKGNAPDLAGEWRIASAPGTAGNWGGSYLAIPAGSRNAHDAWRFIESTQTPDAQLGHFLAGGPLPAASAPYAETSVTSFDDEYFGSSDIGGVLAGSVSHMRYVPRGPDTSTINTELLNALDATEQGTLAPDDAWRSALDAIALVIAPR